MIRFTIRDMFWAMVVAGIVLAWWLDRSRLITAWRNADEKAAATEVERATWETRTQIGAAEHNKLLRAINDHGLTPIEHEGKLFLAPYDPNPRATYP